MSRYGERSTIIEKPARKIPGSTEYVRPKFGMHWLKGNSRPYFSLTGDILEVRHGKYVDVGGGCCHDSIVAAYPELAELVQFHLVDDDGQPMHYVANATYWAELEMGISQWSGKTTVPNEYASFLDVLKRHCLCEALGDGEELERRLAGWRAAHHNEAPQGGRRDFEEWLKSRIPAMKAKFDEVMQKHGVQMITEPPA